MSFFSKVHRRTLRSYIQLGVPSNSLMIHQVIYLSPCAVTGVCLAINGSNLLSVLERYQFFKLIQGFSTEASFCAVTRFRFRCLIDDVYAIVGLTCVYGGMYGILMSSISSFVKHLNGAQMHNLVYALSQTCGGIGALIAPPILPVLQQSLPQNALFFFSASFGALSAIVMLSLLVIKRDKVWCPYTKQAESKQCMVKNHMFLAW